MAHADWKRYYMVVVIDNSANGAVRTYPYVGGEPRPFKKRRHAVALVEAMKRMSAWITPIGIVGIRGNKHNPQLQTWLLEHSQ